MLIQAILESLNKNCYNRNATKSNLKLRRYHWIKISMVAASWQAKTVKASKVTSEHSLTLFLAQFNLFERKFPRLNGRNWTFRSIVQQKICYDIEKKVKYNFNYGQNTVKWTLWFLNFQVKNLNHRYFFPQIVSFEEKFDFWKEIRTWFSFRKFFQHSPHIENPSKLS